MTIKRPLAAIWNHDQVIHNNVIAYNHSWQTGAWFDVNDLRHWPRAMQAQFRDSEAPPAQPGADSAQEYLARDDKGQPVGLALEDLKVAFEDNLYAVTGLQGFVQWGMSWRKHKRYTDLATLRSDLGIEGGSRLAEFVGPGSA